MAPINVVSAVFTRCPEGTLGSRCDNVAVTTTSMKQGSGSFKFSHNRWGDHTIGCRVRGSKIHYPVPNTGNRSRFPTDY